MYANTARGFMALVVVLCVPFTRASQPAGSKVKPPSRAVWPVRENVRLDLAEEAGRQFRVLKAQMADKAWAARVSSQAYRRDALILPGDKSPVTVILRRTEALLSDIERAAPKRDFTRERQELRRLGRAATGGDLSDVALAESESQQALFARVSRLRRRIALANPVLNFDSILLVKRNRYWGHSTGDQYSKPGGGLFVLSGAFGPNAIVRDVLARSVVANGRFKGKKLRLGPAGGPKSGLGAINSLDLGYDARRLVFAYSQMQGSGGIPRNNPGGVHHLFSVNTDGSDLRQLTDGVYSDVWPRWLPDGRIVFISERRRGVSRCGGATPNHVLHTMNADGSGIAAISFHESFEWHPSIAHDGRIVYTRWDYIDRGDCIAHHPWVVAPDGRDPRAIHGNYPVRRNARPDQEQNVMAIPGSHKYVATAAPHHNQAFGSLSKAAANPVTAIVPGKLMGLIQRIAGDSEEMLDVKVKENQILIRTARAILVSSLVQGNFPKYGDVIPKETTQKASINTTQFQHRIRQAALLTNEESKGIRLSFQPGLVTLTSRAPETGEAEVTCPIDYDGEKIEIAFNPMFLTDALKVTDTYEITFGMNAAYKPAVIKSGSDFLYVLMPVDLG